MRVAMLQCGIVGVKATATVLSGSLTCCGNEMGEEGGTTIPRSEPSLLFGTRRLTSISLGFILQATGTAPLRQSRTLGVTHLNPHLLYHVQLLQRQRVLRVIDGADEMWPVKENGLYACLGPIRNAGRPPDTPAPPPQTPATPPAPGSGGYRRSRAHQCYLGPARPPPPPSPAAPRSARR